MNISAIAIATSSSRCHAFPTRSLATLSEPNAGRFEGWRPRAKLHPNLIRTTCKCPPTTCSDKDRWLSASSEDTGDLIAIWSWRLYKESILKSEHWERIVLTPELERYTRALHKKLNLTFDMLTDLHLKTAEQKAD
jgi:hypothetical protein